MLAVWGLVGGQDPKRLSGLRTLMVSTANVMAVAIFIASGIVRWPETLVLLLAATAGGYAGALAGRRAPARVVRVGTLGLTMTITAAFFVRTYLAGP